MPELKEVVQLLTLAGDPVRVGDTTLTPQSQAFVVRWGSHGGLVWNRPLAVMVERNGQFTRMPVVDVTRIGQLALLGVSMLFAIAISAVSARRRRNNR